MSGSEPANFTESVTDRTNGYAIPKGYAVATKLAVAPCMYKMHDIHRLNDILDRAHEAFTTSTR